ncbi:DUF2510 domain-containing protein [Schumannella soli]|uniref:DUF2510 domain-containing protein n=1 Tax=Schumannella soli TaxID=2590779 RepID=A0A506Y1Z3_9MICO|nr:DUF2510 domain-containing protein [Schumannella soli]TPW75467.1 DUF2510 domain-containing protein [Schumannella soli]
MPDSSDSPGWYPDPERRGGQRWWNGAGWSDARRDAPAPGSSAAFRPTTAPPAIPSSSAGPPTLGAAPSGTPGTPAGYPPTTAASGAPGWTSGGAVTGYGAYGAPPTPPTAPAPGVNLVLTPAGGAPSPVNPYEPNPYAAAPSPTGGAPGSPGAPVQYYGAANARRRTNGYAIAGFVVSVLGLSSGFGGVIGVALSIAALRRANRMIRENAPAGAYRGLAIAGIAIGSIGVVIAIGTLVARIVVAVDGG